MVLRTSPKLEFLDGLRGLAAFYVMTGHARSLLWEGYSSGYLLHPHTYGWFGKLLVYGSSVFKFGLEAVFFFFVLSGFVIHLKYATSSEKGQKRDFKYRQYFLKRFRRIYPPFIFALALTYLLDQVSLRFYDGSMLQNLNKIATITFDHSWSTLLKNIGFLYYAYSAVFGSNGPSWSLKYEWWFYIIYPLLMFATARSIVVSTTIILALFILSFFPALWLEPLSRDVFSLMLTWWFGVLLAEAYGRKSLSALRFLPWLIVSFLLVPFAFEMHSVWYYTFVSLGVMGIIAFCLRRVEQGHSLRFLTWFKSLGAFSFTLYIVHYPIFILIRGWWQASHAGELPGNFWLALTSIILVTTLAYLIHFLTEKPFLSPRRPLTRAIT